MKTYENNKSLEEFRFITNTDYGSTVDKKDNETSVKDILTKKIK